MEVRGRRRRELYAVGFAGAAVIGAAACDPTAGGMNTAAIAITTDEMATKELERQQLDVLWISCTARYESKVTPSSGSPDRDAAATVDCQGQAKNDKSSDGTSDITVKGSVWSVVDGRCVRGNLTAKVDGKQWFRVDVLGDCAGGDTSEQPQDPDQPDQPDEPDQPPVATVTVTVTPHPSCSCIRGK
ncbi:hypothetical protein ACWGII_33120 [Streptomyces sp. NPDC054855]